MGGGGCYVRPKSARTAIPTDFLRILSLYGRFGHAKTAGHRKIKRGLSTQHHPGCKSCDRLGICLNVRKYLHSSTPIHSESDLVRNASVPHRHETKTIRKTQSVSGLKSIATIPFLSIPVPVLAVCEVMPLPLPFSMEARLVFIRRRVDAKNSPKAPVTRVLVHSSICTICHLIVGAWRLLHQE